MLYILFLIVGFLLVYISLAIHIPRCQFHFPILSIRSLAGHCGRLVRSTSPLSPINPRRLTHMPLTSPFDSFSVLLPSPWFHFHLRFQWLLAVRLNVDHRIKARVQPRVPRLPTFPLLGLYRLNVTARQRLAASNLWASRAGS